MIGDIYAVSYRIAFTTQFFFKQEHYSQGWMLLFLANTDVPPNFLQHDLMKRNPPQKD